MAGPITWRNLQAPTDGGAGRILQGAAYNLNQGFNNLGDLLKERSQIQDANIETQRSNNTNAFLDQLSQYRTPEELQTAISTGAVDQLRQQFGRNIDAGQVRGAADQRLASLQQQTVANNAFQDDATQRQQRPIADQAGQLIAQGKFSDAQALLNQHELLNESKLWGEMTGEERARAGEQRAVNQDSRAQQSHGLNMANGQVALQSNRLRLEDLKNTQQANEIGRDALRGYHEQMDHIRSGINTVAKEQGFEIDRQGNVVTEGKSEGDLLNLKASLREAGVPDMPSPTQYLEKVGLQMLQSGASPDVIRSVLGSVESSIGANALAQRDKEYISQEVQAVGNQYDQRLQITKAEMEKLEKNNSLLKMDGDPYEAAAKIQSAVKKAAKAPAEQEELGREIEAVMREGIKIDGVYHEVPHSMVLAALSRAGNTEEGWLTDTKYKTFKDVLKDMATDESFVAQWEGFTKYSQLKESANTLNLQKSAAMQAAERKLRQEVGGSYNGVEALQRNLLNRRNP